MRSPASLPEASKERRPARVDMERGEVGVACQVSHVGVAEVDRLSE